MLRAVRAAKVVALLAVVAGCAACGPGDASDRWTGERCAPRITAMRNRLTTAAREPAPILPDDPTVESPVMNDGPAPVVAPIVSIALNQWLLDGRSMGAAAEQALPAIRRDLDVLAANWEILHTTQAAPPYVMLRADRRVRVGELRRLAAALPERRLLLVGRSVTPRRSRLPAEVPALVAKRRHGFRGPNGATALAAAMNEALGSCTEARTAMQRVSSYGPTETASAFAESLPAGLLGCNCRADVDAAEYLVLLVLEPGPTFHTLELTPALLAAMPDAATVTELVAAHSRTGPAAAPAR